MAPAPKLSWWVVPSDLWQQVLSGLTTAPIDQGFEGSIIQAAKKPTAGSFGPYPTKAAAQAKMSALDKQHSAKTNTNIPVISQAAALASGVAEIGHWSGDLITHLTDVYMWISLGWIALGLLLLVLGLMWLLKKTGIMPSGGGVPVPLPV
jgi:hypothetical protein